MFVFQRGAEKQYKGIPYLKFYHSQKHKHEDHFFENPQAAQVNHVPVSMGIIFEVLSTEFESTIDRAWKFLDGKNHLQKPLEIV